MTCHPITEDTKKKLSEYFKETNKLWNQLGMTYPHTVESFDCEVVALAFYYQATGKKIK